MSQEGIQMLDKDVQNWPRPTSCREMSSFLGFAGYYCGFISRYSGVVGLAVSSSCSRSPARLVPCKGYSEVVGLAVSSSCSRSPVRLVPCKELSGVTHVWVDPLAATVLA